MGWLGNPVMFPLGQHLSNRVVARNEGNSTVLRHDKVMWWGEGWNGFDE